MNSNYYKNSPNNIILDDITKEILEKHNALEFHATLQGYKPTPLIHLPELSKKHNVGNIYIKDESHRFGLNAFKVLGASYAIHQLLAKNPESETFCTATDGNHGRAVAWSAKKFGKKAVIYVPDDTTAQRIKVIENEGAKVIQIDGNYDDACQEAEKTSKANNWILVQDMAWEGYEEIPALIMAGYLTLFKELEENLHTSSDSNVDIVFLQAGVGSMAGAGVYYYLNKYGANRPKIVIVEPKEADGILLSFQNNKLSTSVGNSTTIMAGLNCGTPSLGAWGLLKNGTDYSIRIKDKYAKQAIRELYFPTGSDKRIISGESGVGGVAGFLAIMNDVDFQTVKESLDIGSKTNILFISTEGDTDKKVFDQIINDNKIDN
ncbi:MAG: diaminopropionate ammonia-lyase [Salinivirgaceae bacterium]|nr:diaminopropionate ammonia-lyase [Salinivirgaceae bacterium]MDD4746981.1 diaminopropionate ammonia-lyase [Salinivirgaceae bacterium]MDY0280535.1 diaminopropionate ammonia-lyase [Salinivirgaceae bacterium]